MKSKLIKRIIASVITTITVLSVGICAAPVDVLAKESVEKPIGKYYSFGEKAHYEYSSASSSSSTAGNSFGAFEMSGDFSKIDGSNYTVKSGNVALKYSFDANKLTVADTEWHIVSDSSDEVDGITLEDDIKNGTIILQSSFDGVKWATDLVKSNVFVADSELKDAFYTTKDIQQQNGCYFRLVVVYKMERKTGSHKVTFVSVDDIETIKVAEVYEFHIVDNNIESTASATDTPRKNLGKKVNAGKDTRFAENNEVDKDDPHYGWDIGTFFINGYTRDTVDDDKVPVFLKNVGDRVTLWFNLNEDINCLHGNASLSIADDKNGYDKAFEVTQGSFGHGALLIRYTDYEGVPHTPVIYTNYLEANATTGADTRVQLFEEGDYEVTLDYEIKNNPRQVGPVSVVPTYTDYKISFKFKIRNGNCMVFPFDTKTNAELSDKDITPNGFKLDMAKSRYLTIDVSRSVVNVAADGQLSLDERFNRPAKDGETYSEEGVYVFTVKNLYTGGEPTTKTIYVGSDKNLLALAKSKKDISDINQMILDGATIADDGTIIEPEPEPEPVEEVEEEAAEEPELEEEQKEEVSAETPAVASDNKPEKEEVAETDEDVDEVIEDEDAAKGGVPVVLIACAVAACGVGGFAYYKKKASKKDSNKEEKSE